MTVSVLNCFVERGNTNWYPLSITHGMDFFLFNDIFTLLPHQVFRTENGYDDDGGKKINPEQEFHRPSYAAAPGNSVRDNRMEQDCCQNASICVIEDPGGEYRNQDDPQGKLQEAIHSFSY
jgi:hypothetical protein